MSLVGKKLTQFNFSRTRNPKKKAIESRDELDPALLAAQRRDSLEDVSLSFSLNATVMPALRMTKSNSLGSISNDGVDSLLSHNDIERLTQNVRSFSDALNRLKYVFTTDEGSSADVRKNAHERLGELLCELKSVLLRYPTINTIDILTMAALLITKIKSCCYEELLTDNLQMLYNIDQLALAFSSSVSEYLMGDIDNYPLGKTKSHENLLVGDMNSCRPDVVDKRDTSLGQGDIDTVLHKLDNGVDIALQRAKAWSKYAKEILTYVEKKNALEADYAKNVAKLAGSVRHMISEDKHQLFQSIYCLALDQDGDSAKTHQYTCNLIQTQKFVQPLNMRRIEHEKIRKSLKDVWTKELRKMQDAVANLKKAKTMYVSRQQEYEKAKDVAMKAETESLSSSAATKAEKKKKQVDDSLHRAMEAETTYKACVVEANNKQAELERVKADILAQLRELIYTSDQTMKQVTVDYFQLLHTVTATSPVRLQALCESCQQYEPGTQYAEYVRRLPSSATYVRNTEPFVFEPYTLDTGLSDHRKASLSSGSGSEFHIIGDASAEQEDTDSMSGSSSKSVDSSPSASPRQSRRTISSSLGELMPSDACPNSRCGIAVSSDGGMTFRGVLLSRPAQTHVFRKLRTPSRCRECETYVYFQGAECRKCGLASHKKCLEMLHFGCGAKHHVSRRMTTFGVDFTAHVEETHTEIPYLVRRCTKEVDQRGLDLRGIYRVSAVKSKVERLCQSFETCCEEVDLSEHHPNVIANVLKLYLRQLPEPLLTFKLYPDFIQLAKATRDELNGPDYVSSPQFLVALKTLVYQLPTPNFRTCGLLMLHLRRVADQEEDNQMGASNLGIVFGPTLLRPSEGAASLDSLMDTPNQTRMVELLIVNVLEVFFPEIDLQRTSEDESEIVERTETEALTEQTSDETTLTEEESHDATDLSAEMSRSVSRSSVMLTHASGSAGLTSDSLLDELAKEDPRFHQVMDPAATLPGTAVDDAGTCGAGDSSTAEALGVPEGAVGVAPVSPGLKRKLRKRDVLGPGGDNQDPLPVPFHLTKPLLYSPSLQRGGIAVSTSTLSSRSTCSSMTTDSGSDDSRLSQAVTSSQPTDVTDSELESLGGSLRDDSGVTTDDSHDTDGRRQPRYV